MVFVVYINMQNPIGIFDSGVGGLSVWHEIIKLLPNEHTIYLADNKNCPYGDKPASQIIKLSICNADFLISKGCKVIVVACNTATAAAVDILRDKYSIPIVGIEPAIKPAALKTQTGKVGVLATRGTFNGRLFIETSNKYACDIEKINQIGSGLVELVENNELDTENAIKLLKTYIDPMVSSGVDKIVLGCTHYPFLIPAIYKILPQGIEIINPAPAVAARVKYILGQQNLNNTNTGNKYSFYATGRTDVLNIMVKNITGKNYVSKTVTLCTS